MDEAEVRRDLVDFGRRLHERGYVAATDGNLSARVSPQGFLCTPTGLPKEELAENLLARMDAGGLPVSGRPSSEWPLHLALYRARADVGAVVHAHPPFATALACLGRGLDRPLLSEAVLALGAVPLVPFELPSTPELARKTAEILGEGQAALLANHGAVAVGPDVRTAFYRMETLEHTARITLYTDALGGGRALPETVIRDLESMKSRYALAAPPGPPCADCPASGGEGRVVGEEDLVRLLAEFARFHSPASLK
jgi:L-fuculose-phosphate aldolase